MSRRTLYILAVVGLVVVLAAYYFLILSPLRTQISETDAQIAAEQQTLAQNQAKLAHMEQTKAEAAQNQAYMLELGKMMPETAEIPSLLLQIQDLATESGIDFMTISPSEPKSSGAYEVISLGLSLQGTFFDVNDFLYRAEQMVAGPGRLLAVKSVSLSISGDPYQSSPLLGADVDILAFKRIPVAATPATKATLKNTTTTTVPAG